MAVICGRQFERIAWLDDRYFSKTIFTETLFIYSFSKFKLRTRKTKVIADSSFNTV